MKKIEEVLAQLDSDYESTGILDERILAGYVNTSSYLIFKLGSIGKGET